MNTQSAIHAIIFDLANTIVENRAGFSPRGETQSLLGLPTRQHVRNLIYTLSADQPGMTSDEFAVSLVKRTRTTADPDLVEKIKDVFLHNNRCLQLRPDAVDVLGRLRARGIKLGLLSNCTPFARALVDELGLNDLFDTVVLSSDVGIMKPDPRIFSLTMDRLGVAPNRTCVVGDKVKTDILGGMLAGCRTILFEIHAEGPVTDPRLPVDAVVRSLSDVLVLPFLNTTLHN